MRDIAVVAFSQRQEPMINTESEVEFMVPLMNQAKDAVGLTQQDMGFTCSGSSDFLAGQAFSFVMTIDGTGPVPPISESHVEQDGAWALYEAWVKLQCGDIDTAFVYSYGKSSPARCAMCSPPRWTRTTSPRCGPTRSPSRPWRLARCSIRAS